MPEDAIFNQLRLRKRLDVDLTLADIINLEQFFDVSRKAICWRLEDLNIRLCGKGKRGSTEKPYHAVKIRRNSG